jgi:hypothetical protein
LPRSSAHGRDVTRGSRKDLIADRLRRVNLSQKVHIFEKRIGRDNPFRAGAGAQDRGVIAYADP